VTFGKLDLDGWAGYLDNTAFHNILCWHKTPRRQRQRR
jgi:hypothetical protein